MFIKRLQELLEEKDMKQIDLAKAVGVTEVTISRYMTGERKPRVEIANKMAKVLNTNTDYLMGNSDIKHANSTNQVDFPDSFATPEEAMQFILQQKVIMGFGGFDIDTLSDSEKVDFANELLQQLKLLSYKYKK